MINSRGGKQRKMKGKLVIRCANKFDLVMEIARRTRWRVEEKYEKK
jgi:hypothetical protein